MQQTQTITINVIDPASALAPGTPAGDLPQLGASLFNLVSSHAVLFSLLLLATVLATIAFSVRARAVGGQRLNAALS